MMARAAVFILMALACGCGISLDMFRGKGYSESSTDRGETGQTFERIDYEVAEGSDPLDPADDPHGPPPVEAPAAEEGVRLDGACGCASGAPSSGTTSQFAATCSHVSGTHASTIGPASGRPLPPGPSSPPECHTHADRVRAKIHPRIPSR